MTWMQTGSGRAVNLVGPRPEDISFRIDVAPALARIPRFNGQVGGGGLSVAQHCVIGARCILRDIGDRDLALRFLIHDAHEAYIGDLTRPFQEALAAVAAENAERLLVSSRAREAAANAAVEVIDAAIKELRRRLDAAIFAAAGLQPATHPVARAVKAWDARMLETERRFFLGPCPRPWAWDDNPPATVRWPETPRIWTWPDAADAWLALLRDLCPTALASAA